MEFFIPVRVTSARTTGKQSHINVYSYCSIQVFRMEVCWIEMQNARARRLTDKGQ